jgi:hypothetical protein
VLACGCSGACACVPSAAATAGDNRMRHRRPAPLQQLHRQPIGSHAAQRQTQRCGARSLACRPFAQHESRPVMRMRSQLQPAQALRAQARRQPGEQRADMPAFERLLERPELVAAVLHMAVGTAQARRTSALRRAAGVHDQQLLGIDAPLRQHPTRQARRWIEQHHQPARLQRDGKAWAEQAHLSEPRMRQQQLGERTSRPTAAGQLRVERDETAGYRVLAAAPELMRMPQRRMQGFRIGDRPARRRFRPRHGSGKRSTRGHAGRRSADKGQDAHWKDCTFIQLSMQSPCRRHRQDTC